MHYKVPPVVPGRFWVFGAYRDETGAIRRTAHAFVSAISPMHAAQLPIIDLIRDRLGEGMPHAAFDRVEITIKPIRGEGANHAA